MIRPYQRPRLWPLVLAVALLVVGAGVEFGTGQAIEGRAAAARHLDPQSLPLCTTRVATREVAR